MLWLKSFWNDEAGVVLTAEAVLLGTMGVVGATVGFNVVSTSVNGELKDVSHSLRHLDQSYTVPGFQGCRSQTAGSHFQQQDVNTSIAELEEREAELKSKEKQAETQRRERLEELREQLRREAERDQADQAKKEAEVREKLRREADRRRQKAEEEERRRKPDPKKRPKPGDDDDD